MALITHYIFFPQISNICNC